MNWNPFKTIRELRNKLDYSQKINRERADKIFENWVASKGYEIVQPKFMPWTDADVLKLREFYKTESGQKLIAICGSETFQQAMKEANGDSLAKAAGMDFMLRFQFNLASDKELARISEATAAQVATTSDTGEQNDADYPQRSF